MRYLGVFALTLLAGVANAEPPPGERVQMSLERYAKLMATVRGREGPRAAWQRGSVQVSLPEITEGGVFATVTVDGRMSLLADDPAEVPLLPGDVVVQRAQVAGDNAALVRREGVHTAMLTGGKGVRNVALTYLVPVKMADGGVHLLVPLPPLAGASLTVDASELTGGAEGAALEVWPGAQVEVNGDQLTATLPATHAFVLRWADAGRQRIVHRVEYRIRPDHSGDGMDVEATFEAVLATPHATIAVAHGETALISVLEGTKPLGSFVSADWHRATLRGTGRHAVRARFRLPIDRTQGQPQIVLQLTQVPITRLEVSVPGKRTLELEPEVPVTSVVTGEGDRALTRATAYLPPSEQAIVRWTETLAALEQFVRINTETYQLLTIEEGAMRSKINLSYEVIRGKVKELPIEIPDDAVVVKVTGDGVDDWRTLARTAEAPRQLRVFLGSEQEGPFALQIELEKLAPRDEGAPISLPLVRPLGAFRERGVIALFDGDKIGFAPAQAPQFTKVGQDALPTEIRKTLREKVSQAYKHIGAPGPMASKIAAAKVKEVRFDAKVEAVYELTETSLAGNASILAEIKSGRRDFIVMSLPEGLAEPRVTAPSLNKVEPSKTFDAGEGRKAYEIRFTQKLEGALQIDVEFEMRLPKELGRISLPDLRVHGAEVEQGSFGIAAETGIEIQAADMKDLRSVDATELPNNVTKRSDRELALGFHYTHVPWSLALDAKRHKTVETLSAVIVGAWLETNVLANGHIVSRATYRVANNDLQFLELELPDKAKVLTVAAAGRPVKAVADETGTKKIPLPANDTILVDLTYEVTREKLGRLCQLDLVAPQPDMRLSDLQWIVRTPGDLTLFHLDTELTTADVSSHRPVESTASDGRVPSTLPVSAYHETRLFTYAVHTADEAPLQIMMISGESPSGGGWMLSLLAVFCFGFVVRRRVVDGQMGAAGWSALVAGVVIVAVRATVGELYWMEALLAVVVLVVLALVSARPRQG